ncbi:MAG: hypothetical protein K1X29_06110 [Bdellovibrionales bacterium]|nr:hypothetical protein [Bdellovibrionales bacterium]
MTQWKSKIQKKIQQGIQSQAHEAKANIDSALLEIRNQFCKNMSQLEKSSDAIFKIATKVLSKVKKVRKNLTQNHPWSAKETPGTSKIAKTIVVQRRQKNSAKKVTKQFKKIKAVPLKSKKLKSSRKLNVH